MTTVVNTTPQSSLSQLSEQFASVCNQVAQINMQSRELQTSVRVLHKNFRKERQQITRNKKQKKTNTKIHKPMQVSSKLAKFLHLSEPVISKKDAMKQVSTYIINKNLQIAENKRKFVPNKPLMKLFGLKGKAPQLTFVEINKYISPYFTE